MDKKPHREPSKTEPPTTSTSWGGVAEWYDELLEESADSFQAKVILPNLSRVMNLKQGTSVLDVACGQGFFSRTFAQTGAKVTACDISPELVDIARQKSSVTIDYKVAPADALAFAPDGSFDIVTIILALQNIENLQGTFAEVSRVLARGGHAYFVLNHPSFRIPKRSSWQWDEKSAAQYRRIDAYLSDDRIKIDMAPGEKNPRKKAMTLSFHRPLQVYFKALNKSNLVVSRLEEWISHKKSQKGPRQAEEDRVRKEIPMFLMLEAVKK